MALTYTMRIDRLDKKTENDVSNVILRVLWTRIGTDENHVSAGFQGLSTFDLSTMNAESFVAYEDLTEAKVIEWVMSDPQIAGTEAVILQRIAEQAIARVGPGEFPWSEVVINHPLPSGPPIVYGDTSGIGG